jgi:hypothetical protein
MFSRADTLEQLAAKTGIDAAGLATTVREYKSEIWAGSKLVSAIWKA